jgi:hypothetical protein
MLDDKLQPIEHGPTVEELKEVAKQVHFGDKLACRTEIEQLEARRDLAPTEVERKMHLQEDLVKLELMRVLLEKPEEATIPAILPVLGYLSARFAAENATYTDLASEMQQDCLDRMQEYEQAYSYFVVLASSIKH